MDIIHRPDFLLKLYVSETEFCLRLQEKPTQMGSPEDRDRLRQSPERNVLTEGQDDG
jgi:hypothetical protein